MTVLVERPDRIFNRTSPVVVEPFAAEGPGLSAEAVRAELESMLGAHDGAAYELVRAVQAGTAPRERVVAFVGDLHALIVRGATLDGVMAYAGDWHSLDMVVRLTHPLAVAFGYWDDRSLVDDTLELACALGLDGDRVVASEPSTPVAMWLRMREAWSQQGLEAALATSAPFAQWAQAGPALADGLVEHYGVDKARADVLRRLALVDEVVGRDRVAILADIARSAYHQRVVRRATRESLALWAYVWRQWMNGDASPSLAPSTTERSDR